jgi:hypothetical protein
MRYYYLAASAGDYNLEYDVWPKDKAAYTLSNPMSYYNPPESTSDEFVSKMEEYFRESFETADSEDPEIDFSSYAHYMIIHAGSDWQHDVLGDSPVDIPSFFIRVGDGKEVSVDEGNHQIYHACNVPATISQDFEISDQDGYSIHSGYGALNSVLFHEFGHSLGLVDLYNVRNFSPMVGAFDIMDSGGAGILVDELPNGDLIYVEGVLPALPGAFSRALLFQDNFRDRGLMKDITELEPYVQQGIAASSLKQSTDILPSIIKYPISEYEYYLIENRNLDPDDDGGTAVYGTLGDRVVLYPTAADNPFDIPTYEYDYLLPSFITPSPANEVKGGGLLVWYVNEKVLYEEGTVLEDGSFWSNFDNNSVNTNFASPGVMVLEADGIRDLGEYNSWYWTGTAYEYFHKHKAMLNNNGDFLQWSMEPWRPTLSAHTKPALLGENGLGNLYYLDEISDPAPIMSFNLKMDFFDESFYFDIGPSGYAGEPINTIFSELSLPFAGAMELRLISSLFDDWLELVEPSQMDMYGYSYPLQSVDNNQDGFKDLVGVLDTHLQFLDYSSGELSTHSLSMPHILYRPLIDQNDVYVFNSNMLYRLRDFEVDSFVDLENISQIAVLENYILAQREQDIVFLDKVNLNIERTLSLQDSLGDARPVICKTEDSDEVFITSNKGNIYRISISGQLAHVQINTIFVNHHEAMPSQPALLAVPGKDLRLFFGIADHAYLISFNGAMQSGFPRYLDQVKIAPHKDARAMNLNDEVILSLPLESGGYAALNEMGEPRWQYNLIIPYDEASTSSSWSDFLYYDAVNMRLLWYYTIQSSESTKAYIHSLDVATNPILFNGYQNGAGGTVYGELEGSPAVDTALKAYVFPNPVKKGFFRIKVDSAYSGNDLVIYDIAGQRVYETKRDERNFDLDLDSTEFSSGVYLVLVKNQFQRKIIKFAVEK